MLWSSWSCWSAYTHRATSMRTQCVAECEAMPVQTDPESVATKHTVAFHPPWLYVGAHAKRLRAVTHPSPPAEKTAASSLAPAGSGASRATEIVTLSTQFSSATTTIKRASRPIMSICVSCGVPSSPPRTKKGAGSSCTRIFRHFSGEAAGLATRPVARSKWRSTASKHTVVTPTSARHGRHRKSICDVASPRTVEKRIPAGAAPMVKPTLVSRHPAAPPCLSSPWSVTPNSDPANVRIIFGKRYSSRSAATPPTLTPASPAEMR
mmetsp:Transcript_40084/g.95063  ORF Transcript_40084/g.95063 Transcript_40084/m.95063 type:complete len:265 (-) Transcript_40084:1550-2344(-)